jgi:8-oxo-dGTP diphosphatase
MQKPASDNTKIKRSHMGIYAIIEKGSKILLVRKSRGPYRGSWDLPGGRPVHGESIFQTLQREVMEETGIRLIDAVPHSNHAFLIEYKDGVDLISLHHTCLIYQATQFDSSQFREHVHEEDVAGCAWIEKSQLEHLPLSKVVLCAF